MVDMEPRIHSREAGQGHQALTPERSLAATPSGVPFGDRYQTLFQPIPKHRLNSSSLKHWRPRSLPSGSDSSSGTSDASTEICWKKYVQNHRECKCYPFLPLCPLQLLPPHEGEKRKKKSNKHMLSVDSGNLHHDSCWRRQPCPVHLYVSSN